MPVFDCSDASKEHIHDLQFFDKDRNSSRLASYPSFI